MKLYIAIWNSESAYFAGKNIKQAKMYAQFYKRRNEITGPTVIKLVKK